ncbi:MAG TPA: hypothetical protein VK783_08330 [Bacteroidia bacterium]|jgi:hypothetical protein|nr:hypothetical protein [Bacteroidia bacterium]
MKNQMLIIALLIFVGNTFALQAQTNKGKTATEQKPIAQKKVAPAPKTAKPNFKPGTGVPKPNEVKAPPPTNTETK